MAENLKLKNVKLAADTMALLALVCASVMPAAQASDVQVVDCNTVFTVNLPLPLDFIEPRFTVRRHIEESEPYELLETSAWAQGKFRDNGYFEVTYYPLDDPPRTVRSLTVETTVQDGFGQVGDEVLDQGVTFEKPFEVEGYTLDSVNIILKRQDGMAITDHKTVPAVYDTSVWDPPACPPACFQGSAQCVVTFKAPGDGIECNRGGGAGGTICTHGSYFSSINSVTQEPHEGEHGSTFIMNAGLNDAWVNSDAPFQGLFVTVYPELGIVFVAWFTFDKSLPEGENTAGFGGDNQRWVTAVGSISGNKAAMTAELTTGGKFHSAEPVPSQNTTYGTLDLSFDNCSTGTISFEFPTLGESGTFSIQRTLEDNVALCETLDP